MREVRVHQSALVTILDDCLKSSPREACGLLYAKGELTFAYVCHNMSDEEDSFSLDPDDQLAFYRLADEGGYEMIGTYHSHPAGTGRPSQGDLQLLMPGMVHIVVGLSGWVTMRAWAIEDGMARFVTIELEAEDGAL